MRDVKNILCLIICLLFLTVSMPSFAFIQNIEGLNFEITKIENFPLDKAIVKDYNLYELFIENNSTSTYSIPGYSIDFGVNYFNILELSAQLREKISKKLAILNIAAAAVFLPFGGFARNAGRTAASSFSSFRKRNLKIDDNKNLLSADKTYILYPGDRYALYFLVSKKQGQPKELRMVCKNEELNVNYVLINDKVLVDNIVLDVTGKFRKKYETKELPLSRDVGLEDENEFTDNLIADPDYLDLEYR